MITQEAVDRARRLLSLGRDSQRQIARQTGLSRSYVSRLALGRPVGRITKRPTERPIVMDPERIDRAAEKCLKCGKRVILPCVACQTLAYKRHKKLMGGLR